MPNHIVTEIIIPRLAPALAKEIAARCCNEEGRIDFAGLVPIPPNVWLGSVGVEEERAFKLNALNWCRENWGTKWNAYQCLPVSAVQTAAGVTLTLTFQTAWSTPYGWMLALFNVFGQSFEYRFLDEGSDSGHRGWFDADGTDLSARRQWGEAEADDELNIYLHRLRWGDAADEIMAERAEGST